MRIWSLHPAYLDTKGLLAVWRETLLAQKVLKGLTRGYKNHPQLARFKAQTEPVAAIASYLKGIHDEALRRGYNFSRAKIETRDFKEQLACTRGQLLYEWNHLKGKLKNRDAEKYRELQAVTEPSPHPLFKIIEGEIEDWEVSSP